MEANKKRRLGGLVLAGMWGYLAATFAVGGYQYPDREHNYLGQGLMAQSNAGLLCLLWLFRFGCLLRGVRVSRSTLKCVGLLRTDWLRLSHRHELTLP